MAKKRREVKDPYASNPAPVAGAGKKAVDAVMGLLKAGNGAVSLLAGLLASALILYSGYVLYDSFSTQQRAYSGSWDLLKYKPQIIEDGAEPSEGKETLAEIVRDYRAWLTLYDTNVDYPVVQGQDDLYYASHDIYQNVSLTGAIYLAAANNGKLTDSYNLAYGHHMDNGAMFGGLDDYRDEGYLQSHREGILVSTEAVYDLKVFAVAETDAYESRIYSVGNRAADVKAFLTGDRSQDAGLGTRVLFYDRAEAKKADKILAMSTCDSAETNGRLVVFARMILRDLPTFTPAPTEEPAETPAPSESPTAADETEPTAPTDKPTPAKAKTPKATPTLNPGPFNLEIRYEYVDGTTAAPTHYEKLLTGEDYNVRNPVIPGYVTARIRVQGEMGSQHTVIVVLYIPEEMAEKGETTSIDEYEVPLGMENLHAQMGVCIE